jgi:hypothetical protein
VRKKASEGRHSGLIDIAAADLLEKVCCCRAMRCCDLWTGRLASSLAGNWTLGTGRAMSLGGSLGTLVQSVGSMCLVYFSKELGPFQAFLRFFDITSPSNGFRSQ